MSNYLDDIMAYLKDDQCKDSKCAICFALMVARRKKKRQRSRMKQVNPSKASTDGQTNIHHILNSLELPYFANSSLSPLLLFKCGKEV